MPWRRGKWGWRPLGRTNPTFRDLLRATEERWEDYRRALRARDQRVFDQLFEDARAHADAAGYLNHQEPLFPVLMSMLLEQQRRIGELEDRISTLEIERGERPVADQDTSTPAGTDGGRRRLPDKEDAGPEDSHGAEG